MGALLVETVTGRTMAELIAARDASTRADLVELRLDNDLDVTHGVVGYLELLKLAALLNRPEGQSVDEALAQVNAVTQIDRADELRGGGGGAVIGSRRKTEQTRSRVGRDFDQLEPASRSGPGRGECQIAVIVARDLWPRRLIDGLNNLIQRESRRWRDTRRQINLA